MIIILKINKSVPSTTPIFNKDEFVVEIGSGQILFFNTFKG
jgi:hypothetical protein